MKDTAQRQTLGISQARQGVSVAETSWRGVAVAVAQIQGNRECEKELQEDKYTTSTV